MSISIDTCAQQSYPVTAPRLRVSRAPTIVLLPLTHAYPAKKHFPVAMPITSSSPSPCSEKTTSSTALAPTAPTLATVKSIAKKPVCGALTKKGTRCQNTIITRSGICPVHHAQRKKKTTAMYQAGQSPVMPPPVYKRTKAMEELLEKTTPMKRTRVEDGTANGMNYLFETPAVGELIPALALEALPPTSPLTDEEMEAGGFWNPPNLALLDDDVELGNMLNLDETAY